MICVSGRVFSAISPFGFDWPVQALGATRPPSKTVAARILRADLKVVMVISPRLAIVRIGWIVVSGGPVGPESVVAIETVVVPVIDQLRVVVGRASDALAGLVDMNHVVLDLESRVEGLS